MGGGVSWSNSQGNTGLSGVMWASTLQDQPMFPRGDKGTAIPHQGDHRILFSKLQ